MSDNEDEFDESAYLLSSSSTSRNDSGLFPRVPLNRQSYTLPWYSTGTMGVFGACKYIICCG
ncbi:unnamed protein product, partial [Nesidiocoris tenuis]